MTAPDETERLARVALSRASEPGDLTTASLVAQLGPVGAVQRQLEPKTDSLLHVRLAAVDPEGELARAARVGIRFVAPGDDEWPVQLDDLEAGEVEHLGMGLLPVGLWVRGPMPLTRLRESVAVVGSRSATTYGCDVARSIAGGVVRAGLPVVSGAAVGIDDAAHRGALSAGGPTVAVLACGPDRAYPVQNADVLRHLWSTSAVVSEAPPGSAPTRPRFLARNRLIAGLTRGTVLVEAAVRSGALNTATWAELLSRQVMGVPGPVGSAASQGVHERIRLGTATLVSHAAEVLELVGATGEHLVEVPRAPERPRDRLSAVEQQVLEHVPVVSPARIDSIADAANAHVRITDPTLRRLRDLGFVELLPAGWRLAREPGNAV